jgi:hypothetical protein
LKEATERIVSLDSLGRSIVSAVEFAAAHFYVFSESDLSRLSDSQLRQILSCDSLRLENEDCLYGQIRCPIDRDRVYCSLLESVVFEFLSSMKELIDGAQSPVGDRVRCCFMTYTSSRRECLRAWYCFRCIEQYLFWAGSEVRG